MKKIVIYKSKYGATDRYANWIGEELSCPVVEMSDFKKEMVQENDVIIYGGGVHAGGIRGWEDFKKYIKPYLDDAYYQGLDQTEGASITGDLGRLGLNKFLKSYRKDKEKTFVEKEMDRQREVELIKENYHPEKKVVCFAVGINVQNFNARAELRNVNFDKRFLRPIPCYYFDGAFDMEKVKGVDKSIINMMKRMVEGKGLNATKDERELLKRITEGCDLVDRAEIEPLVREVLSYDK